MLTMWTIYDHPKDFPKHIVAREWHTAALPDSAFGKATPTKKASPYAFRMRRPTRRHVPEPGPAMLFASLDDARRHLQGRGLVLIPRNPSDDPCIVETWI